MLRVLISGLLLSSIQRTTIAAQSQNLLRKTPTLANTCRKYSIMNEQQQEGEPMVRPFDKTTGPKQEELQKEEEAKPLPKLSAQEFKKYNHMAEHMNYYHDHFRQTWNILYTAASSNRRPAGMSIRTYLNTAAEFVNHLTIHHTIEERHIFPVLARKMPAFREELQLLTHHKLIHEGLVVMGKYVEECKGGERELRMEEFKEIMDGFGGVLWEHLDAEVGQLGGENMRKYWTLEEMRRMPM